MWWWALGVEDAYGQRGEREARWGSWREKDVDIGRRWRAWRRPGERKRRWRGLGVEDAYRRRGEREARCCSRGKGDADMGRRWCALVPHPPWICHVGVRRRWRLVVRVG